MATTPPPAAVSTTSIPPEYGSATPPPIPSFTIDDDDGATGDYSNFQPPSPTMGDNSNGPSGESDGVTNVIYVQTSNESYSGINIGPLIFSVIWLIALIILASIIVITVMNNRRKNRNKSNKKIHNSKSSNTKNKNDDDVEGEEEVGSPTTITTTMATATVLPFDEGNATTGEHQHVDNIIVEAVDVETAVFGNNDGEDKRRPQSPSSQENEQVIVNNTRSKGGCCPYGISITIISIITSLIALSLSIIVHSTCQFISMDNTSDDLLAFGIWSLQYTYRYDDLTQSYVGGDDQCYSYGYGLGYGVKGISAVLRVTRATSIMATTIGGVTFLVYLSLFGCKSQAIKNIITVITATKTKEEEEEEEDDEMHLRQLRNILSRPIWITSILQLSTLVLFLSKECQNYGNGCDFDLGAISAITATMYWLLCGVAVSTLPIEL